MIDAETYRVRIGLFACKRRSTGSMTHHDPSFAHNSHFASNMHRNSLFWPIYAFFITYFLSLSLALTLSFKTDYSEVNRFHFSQSSTLTLPVLFYSYLKQFSAIIFSFVVTKIFKSYRSGKIRFHCRVHHLVAYFLFWIYSMNIFLIIVVNPSLLNPGPQCLNVAYQNVQGLIPFSMLSSAHPMLDRSKISELQAYAIKSKPDIIALNETWLKKSISNNEILPDSQYEVFRNDRTKRTHPQDPNNPNKFRENGRMVVGFFWLFGQTLMQRLKDYL